LTGTCCENKRQLTLLNIYGPCTDQITFWDKVSDLGLLAGTNLIVAGDFNFTLNVDEVWGNTTLQDQAAGHLKSIFLRNKLVDIIPEVITPTWRNGRSGSESISKRLDRVFISEELLNHMGRYRSWVTYPFLSDHAPVILQLDTSTHRSTYPFKLNPTWLKDPYFSQIVYEVWTDQNFLQEKNIQRRLVWKLKLLKQRVKSWEKTEDKQKH
jgi:hypothetical protein